MRDVEVALCEKEQLPPEQGVCVEVRVAGHLVAFLWGDYALEAGHAAKLSLKEVLDGLGATEEGLCGAGGLLHVH